MERGCWLAVWYSNTIYIQARSKKKMFSGKLQSVCDKVSENEALMRRERERVVSTRVYVLSVFIFTYIRRLKNEQFEKMQDQHTSGTQRYRE